MSQCVCGVVFRSFTGRSALIITGLKGPPGSRNLSGNSVYEKGYIYEWVFKVLGSRWAAAREYMRGWEHQQSTVSHGKCLFLGRPQYGLLPEMTGTEIELTPTLVSAWVCAYSDGVGGWQILSVILLENKHILLQGKHLTLNMDLWLEIWKERNLIFVLNLGKDVSFSSKSSSGWSLGTLPSCLVCVIALLAAFPFPFV